LLRENRSGETIGRNLFEDIVFPENGIRIIHSDDYTIHMYILYGFADFVGG
jgi:hypothetical protein